MEPTARTAQGLLKTNPGWRLLLASASERRSELLRRVGLQPKRAPVDVDEKIGEGETAETASLRIAQAKGREAARLFEPQEDTENNVIIAADTLVGVVVQNVGDLTLGKPKNDSDAKTMLGFLSGRSHRVTTAYAVMHHGRNRTSGKATLTTAFTGLIATEVFFRTLSVSAINAYVATGEPMGKAGAYAIQGVGAALIERVEGNITNVIGLPLDSLVADLIELGAVSWNG